MTFGDEKVSPMYIVKNIIGCKWSLQVINTLNAGIVRPGEVKKAIPGISEKVLNERFKKFIRFGLIEKKVFPVSPPKVEYKFTQKGKKFLKILDSINKFSDI